MDFKNLESIANKQAKQAGPPKKSKFEMAIKKGMRLLKQSHAEGFSNPETLQVSCGCFIDAITFKRTDIRPYLALAYIFTILEDFRTAEEYAYAAMKLEPNNTEIATFVEEVMAFKKEVKQQIQTAPNQNQPLDLELPTSQVTQQSMPATPNYRALYQEIENFILEKVKNLFASKQHKIEPTFDQNKFKIFQQSVQNLDKVIKYIEQQLSMIEQGMNVAQLRQKITPFKVLKGRYAQALNTSKMLMEINDTIELWSFKTDKQVQVVNQKLTMSALTYGRVDVNRMMDGCDLIADQLDQLSEDENIDISLVESSYEKLLELVESLNGMVDDAKVVKDNKKKLDDILF